MSKKYKLLHPRSSQVIEEQPKLPTSDTLEIGEIAINFAKDYETLSIINNSGETVPFSSDRKLKKTNINIPYVKTDQTGRSATLSGTCLELDSLQEGQSIILHITSATTTGNTYFPSACTLDLKLSDGTYAGPQIIYYGGTSKLTTHYGGGNDIRLTFHSGLTIGTTTGLTGWWVEGNYYSDTDTKGRTLEYFGIVKAGNPGIQRYSLALMNSGETWTSITKNSATGQTSSATTIGFILGSDILYYTATGLTTGGTGAAANGFIANYTIDFRYSSNCTTGATSNSPLTTGNAVYLVGTVNPNDGLFYLDTTKWWTQQLPTTEDGKVYIFLGCAYSSYQLALWAEHPIYEFKNGHIRQYQEDNTPYIITTSEEFSGLTTSGSLVDAKVIKDYVDDSEYVTAAALNDLNDRMNALPPKIDTVEDFASLEESGYVVDAKVVKDVIIENELIDAEALNLLNTRLNRVSGMTISLVGRVDELENNPGISYVTFNNSTYYPQQDGNNQNYIDLGNGFSYILLNGQYYYANGSGSNRYINLGTIDVTNSIKNYIDSNTIRTIDAYAALSQSGSLVDAYVMRQVIRDNELVTSNALNDLNDRVKLNASAITELQNATVDLSSVASAVTLNGVTHVVSGGGVDLGTIVTDLSGVASAITINNKTYTVTNGGVNIGNYISGITMNGSAVTITSGTVALGDVVKGIIINESATTLSGGVVNVGNYIPMAKELTISSSLNDLNDRIIQLNSLVDKIEIAIDSIEITIDGLQSQIDVLSNKIDILSGTTA